MILQEEITFNDLLFIDHSLYTSLKNLKETDISQNNNLEIFYSIEIAVSSAKIIISSNLDLSSDDNSSPVTIWSDTEQKHNALFPALAAFKKKE